MKREAQQIAIAEACGTHQVVRLPFDNGTLTHITDENGRIRTIRQIDDGPRNEIYPRDWIPLADYLNDLNAMHEAEKTLDQMQARLYADHLAESAQDGAWASCHMWHQSAAQRAEAFLRTLNLWTE